MIFELSNIVRDFVYKQEHMKIVNFSEFRSNLAESLNGVNNDKEIVIVSRTKGKNAVVMDLNEYNSIVETLHPTSSSANRKRLAEFLDEMNRQIVPLKSYNISCH